MYQVQVSREPSLALLRLLEQHIPYSLPLLRRLQFTKFPGGCTQDTRILFASSSITTHHSAAGDSGDDGKDPSAPFAAAYVDFSRGPETEVWMYSSLEARQSEFASPEVREHSDPAASGDEQTGREVEAGLAIAVLREVKTQRDAYTALGNVRKRVEVLLGTFSEKLRLAVVDACASAAAGLSAGALLTFPSVEMYDKWLMRIDTLPDVPDPTATFDGTNGPSGDGDGTEALHWTQVRREDIAMVLSRTSVPRQERTMVLLPSMALAKHDGTLIAWAFLGPDSSLTSLHCEPEYRSRGLAKAVAVKIFKEHLGRFGNDGYCFADVAPDNRASQGVCKSLGAKAVWRHSWTRIDLDKSFPGK